MPLKKILIIDDEPLIRKTTALLLKKSNIDAITAASGDEGLALAEKERPEMILLDIIMPEMDGWAVLDRFKANPDLARIPVVVFTAMDFSLSDRLAKEKGASAICRKPFQPHQLMKIIDDMEKEAANE